MAEKRNYPMLSEKNWWLLRDKFIASLPQSVSPLYIKSLLSLSSEASANSNVINPLKNLGLLDDDNKTTALTNDWRLDEKYKSVCDRILKSVYPADLLSLFPNENIDTTVAVNWFMSFGIGNSAASKMVALFTLLRSGKIKDKESRTSSPANKRKTRVVSKSKTNNKREKEPKNQELLAQEAKSFGSHPNLHIDLQIHISPESTPDQIETIFKCMAKHLYRDEKL